MPAKRLALLALVLLAACAGTHSGTVPRVRQLVGDGLCEDVHTLVRGPTDRVRAHRLAPCDAADAGAPVVFYLPGMHMNAGTPPAGTGPDLRRHLATSGIRVWSIDYRTHAVPADASPEQLAVLATWTARVFADDVEALAGIARVIDPGPFVVAGFSYGAGLAYDLAARDHPLAGLVILDGAPPAPRDGPTGGPPAIDVGGSRLPWAERGRLLAAVLADPAGPSPVAGFTTAGGALAGIVHSARSFGGNGGLSGVKAGATDVRALAGLLATYDRWWPRAALGADAITPRRPIPVLAFAAGNMGSAWLARVRAGAQAFGGDGATVHELEGYGHVDVLIGREAPRLVFEPVRRFVLAQRDAPGAQPGPWNR